MHLRDILKYNDLHGIIKYPYAILLKICKRQDWLLLILPGSLDPAVLRLKDMDFKEMDNNIDIENTAQESPGIESENTAQENSGIGFENTCIEGKSNIGLHGQCSTKENSGIEFKNTAQENSRLGLVMEGGAMRGLFTCGVIDEFMENGISFDGAVGTSAGATFGCNIKSGQIGRALRYNKRFCRDKRYASLSSYIRTGNLFNVEFCYHDIPYIYDIWDEQAFCENPMEFYTVSTDIETGKAVYYKCRTGDETDIEWIRASSSMPLLSRIVEIDGRKLLDGGIGDSIAIRFMQKMGYDKNTCILTQPKGYEKKKNRMLPVFKTVYREYPEFIKAVENRHLRYNETLKYIEEQENLGKVFVIRPPEPLGIGRMEKNPDKLQEVYDIGRKTAKEKLERLIDEGFCRKS